MGWVACLPVFLVPGTEACLGSNAGMEKAPSSCFSSAGLRADSLLFFTALSSLATTAWGACFCPESSWFFPEWLSFFSFVFDFFSFFFAAREKCQ